MVVLTVLKLRKTRSEFYFEESRRMSCFPPPAVELDCADSPVRVIDGGENQREMGEGWHQWTGSGTTRGNKPTLH